MTMMMMPDDDDDDDDDEDKKQIYVWNSVKRWWCPSYHARSDVRRRLKDNPGHSLVAWRRAERPLIGPILLHVFCKHFHPTQLSRHWGRVKLLSAAGSKKVFAISKWRMVSNVRISRIIVSTKKHLETTQQLELWQDFSS